MAKKIVVLMGGKSSEREISLMSGSSCLRAVAELGYDAVALEISKDASLLEIAKQLQEINPDVVFNALHGVFGEDGGIQAILEYMQIPYTHSGVLASALAMDKARAKILAKDAGVNVAKSIVMSRFDLTAEHPMNPPYVIKPVYEGSSFGVVLVKEGEPVPVDFLRSDDWKYGDQVMVEAYIPGRELTCAIMDNKAMDVCEIFTDNKYKFYDLSAKYTKGGSSHECPAKISQKIYKDVQIMSLAAHRAIGCKGVSRSDFRYDEVNDKLVWLEINTQPGMTQLSLVPDIAKAKGIVFNDLVRWMLEDASCGR